MSAATLVVPFSPRSAQIEKLKEDNKTLHARAALDQFLHHIHRLQKDMRQSFQRLKRYQAFLSYAWGADGDLRFEGLRRLLRAFDQDLKKAGAQVFFDEKHMVGDIDAQMREGIDTSDLVLLFGTEVYQQKTQADSKTNVKKELDFALEKHIAKHGLLVPLLLEGRAKDIFSAPGLGYSQIIVDATAWAGLDQEQYDTHKYIHALTTYHQSVGILPALLGLQNADPQYQERYQLCEEALQAKLDKIYAAPAQKEDGNEARKESDLPINPARGVNNMEHDSSFNPIPAVQLLIPLAEVPSVAPELVSLQRQLAGKDQAIEAFTKRTGGRARLEAKIADKQKALQEDDLPEDDREEATKAIQKAKKDLEELNNFESEHAALKKQIAVLAGEQISDQKSEAADLGIVFRSPVNFKGPVVVGDKGAAGGNHAVVAPIHAGGDIHHLGGIGNRQRQTQ